MRRWLAAAILLGGCVDTVPRTQVTLEIDAEPMVRSMTTSVVVQVKGGEAGMPLVGTFEQEFRLDDPNVDWPIRVAIVPRDNDATRIFQAEVGARQNDASLVFTGVRSSFVEGFTSTLRVLLTADCLNVVCSAGEVCVEGGVCVPPELFECVDPVTLEPLAECQVGNEMSLPAVAVAAGGRHTCAIDVSRRVWCWGDNTEGQAGVPDPLDVIPDPVLTPIIEAVQIVAGNEHTCVLGPVGEVRCWGAGGEGRLGPATGSSTSDPQLVFNAGIASLAAGARHTCALDETSDTLLCWGANDSGQLGRTGDPAMPRAALRALDGMPVTGIVGFDAGSRHTCVGVGGGGSETEFGCVGWDGFGQLGNGAGSDDEATFRFTSFPFQRFAAGRQHTCALSEGSVSCWGDGTAGQTTFDPTAGQTPVPMPIDRPVESAVAIVAGDEFTCMRSDTGLVSCWGSNVDGQLGDGSFSTEPGPMPNLVEVAAVVELSAGARHVCVVTDEQDVLCWGDNDRGQLGQGHTEDEAVPVPVLLDPMSVGAVPDP